MGMAFLHLLTLGDVKNREKMDVNSKGDSVLEPDFPVKGQWSPAGQGIPVIFLTEKEIDWKMTGQGPDSNDFHETSRVQQDKREECK